MQYGEEILKMTEPFVFLEAVLQEKNFGAGDEITDVFGYDLV